VSRNVERAKAGGAGVMVGVISMWVLSEYVGFTPPPEIGDAMMGLIVVAWGAVHSRFIGAA
jgi:hypothetical protein